MQNLTNNITENNTIVVQELEDANVRACACKEYEEGRLSIEGRLGPYIFHRGPSCWTVKLPQAAVQRLYQVNTLENMRALADGINKIMGSIIMDLIK